MNLLYFITGNNIQHHAQCYFSMLSFMSQKDVTSVFVYTDYPQFYNNLGIDIHVEVLSKEQIRDWHGETNYFWRVKIKTVEDFILKNLNQPFIYLDTDTFLYTSSRQLVDGLNNSQGFMHKREGDIAKMKHGAAKMWQQLEGRTFGGIHFKDSAYMWNAGLIAMPAKDQLKTVRLALAICDEMRSAGITPFVAEQFSFSTAMNHCYSLQPAEQMVGHYWGNKEGWNNLITSFFMEAYLYGKSAENIISELKSFNYNQLPINRPVNNTQQRLIKLIKKLIPEKKDIWLDIPAK